MDTPPPSPIDAFVTFLATRDLQATHAFWGGLLGLPLVIDQGACRVYRVAGTGYVGFCERADEPATSGLIATLVTDDVDGWHDRLAAAGVAFEKEPADNPQYRIRHCFFRDPNGYLVEIQRFHDADWETGGWGGAMTERWGTDRWSVRLPDDWTGETDDDGTKILAPPVGESLLQVRDFLSDGPAIGDDDLRELAKFHVERGAVLIPVRYGGGFTGFHVHFEAEGTLWWEWWLRRERLALHVTWHVPSGADGRDEATAAAILNSLRDESGGAEA